MESFGKKSNSCAGNNPYNLNEKRSRQKVVDARNPLLYYSEDLVSYAKELDPMTETVLLLNKADLVDIEIRRLWADHFDSKGVRYIFWSAKSANHPSETKSENNFEERESVQSIERLVQSLDAIALQIRVLSFTLFVRRMKFREKNLTTPMQNMWLLASWVIRMSVKAPQSMHCLERRKLLWLLLLERRSIFKH